jgi:hypothetical protein
MGMDLISSMPQGIHCWGWRIRLSILLPWYLRRFTASYLTRNNMQIQRIRILILGGGEVPPTWKPNCADCQT